MRSPAAWWAHALEHQQHRDAHAAGRTWDLRLLPAAGSAWLTGLLGTLLPIEQAAAGATAGLLLLVLAATAAGILRRAPPGNAEAAGVRRTVPWSAVVLAALTMAAVLLSTAAAHRDTTRGPLGEVLAEGGTITATAGVAEAPRRWSAPAAPAHAPGTTAGEDRTGVAVQLVLQEVLHRGSSTPVAVPATVFADGPGWAGLRPGQRVTAVLTAAPGTAPGAVVLRAAAPPIPLLDAEPGRRELLREAFVLAAAELGPAAAGLLPGMTFGERSGLGPELDQAMKDTGLTHLTAVSGANCALVTALAGHAALAAGAGRRTCLLAGLGALAGFVVLVGPDPSVLRAATMGGLAAAGLLTGRTAVSLATLSGAVIALVVARPALAAEYGFVLSVLATAGIVVSGRPLTRLLGARVPELLAVAIAIPAVAQLWCAPVLVLLQPAVPLYALPANVLAAPLVPVVTVCGLAGLLLLNLPGTVNSPVVLLPLTVGAVGTRGIARIAHTFAGAPVALARWPEGLLGVALMTAMSVAALAAVHALDARRRRPGPSAGTLREGPAPSPVPEETWRLRARQRRRRRTAVAAVLLLALVLLAARTVLENLRPPPAWEAVVCDVGQGDAVLLRTAPGRAVLVDTGPDPRALERCLARSGVRQLDLVILTHGHADHTGGLPALARHGPVAEIWYSTAAPGLPPGLTEALPAIPVSRPAPGETWAAGALRLTVLAAPSPRAWARPSSADENNASLAVRAELTGQDGATLTWLLAGDLQEEGAAALVRADGALADVDVLKVSHHGARNGGTEILDAASPRLAVISVGRDNDYGHPHPAILAHLERRGVPVLRTDEHGGIYLLRADGRLRAVPMP